MSNSTKETTPLLRDTSQPTVCLPMTKLSSASTTASVTSNDHKERLVSLDQYRGFVILCALIVPLLARLNATPDIFRHHQIYFSIADATMPQFYLAIGFAMQLTLERLRAKKGFREVLIKQLRRSRTLYIIGFIFHGFDNQNSWTNLSENWPKLLLQPIWSRSLFSTLTIISVAQLIIIPVIARSVWIRVCYMIGLITVYIIGQWIFFFELQWTKVVDGGSFGTFSWASVMLAGTLLNDWNEWIRKVPSSNVIARRRRVIIASVGLLLVAGASWLLGYLVSSIPASWSPVCFNLKDAVIVCPNVSLPSIPFVAPQTDVISMWTMSQRTASISIQLTGLGYSLLVYFFWFVVSDVNNLQFSFLKTLSTHALIMFILRSFGFNVATTIIPRDSPLYMLPILMIIGFGTNIVIVQYLKSNNINLRI